MAEPLRSRPMDVLALHEALRDREMLEEEFERAPHMLVGPDTLPNDPRVAMKNRYTNILPTPATRVPLSQIGPDALSTYMNANFVDGYNQPKEFIATQGPKPETVDDFWRMVWEYRSEVVVMMTGIREGGRIKCHRYWPEHTEAPLDTQNFQISIASTENMKHYILTKLTLEHRASGATRAVSHFWFTNWPDHGVPHETWEVIDLVKAVRRARTDRALPAVVHCSAGIGRTGTFLAVDMGIRSLNNPHRVVDVFGDMIKLRTQRGGSIQTFVQYLFVHQAMKDYVTPGNSFGMFGDNTSRDVGIIKGSAPSFGFTMRGSWPPFILQVAPGSPAEKSGVLPGDQILAINQQPVHNLKHAEVAERARQSGGVITLTLLSKKLEETLA